jgi:hypothetical protein
LEEKTKKHQISIHDDHLDHSMETLKDIPMAREIPLSHFWTGHPEYPVAI